MDAQEIRHPVNTMGGAMTDIAKASIDSYAERLTLNGAANPPVANKADAGKIDYTLIPDDAHQLIARGFMFGAVKYGEWNWTNGFPWRRLFASLLRHVYAALRGEDTDPESGLPHLALAGCNVYMLLAHTLRGYGLDNRFKEGATKLL